MISKTGQDRNVPTYCGITNAALEISKTVPQRRHAAPLTYTLASHCNAQFSSDNITTAGSHMPSSSLEHGSLPLSHPETLWHHCFM